MASSSGGAGTGPDMVDWDLAVRIGSRLAGEGPQVGRDEADAVVAELRADANRSTGLVRDFTGLVGGRARRPGARGRPGRVGAGQRRRLPGGDLADGREARLEEGAHRAEPGRRVSRITGAEVGGLLGFLAGKVLGQFDPFHAPDGRLLLVAPNIVHVERELDVDPHDFRLWVCLHEETHRVQFTAVPWMRDHLFSEIAAIAETMEPSKVLDEGLQRVTEAIRGGLRGGSLIDLMGTPEQKEILDRVTGMMSLLEGHADVVMDGVGPSVIPTVGDDPQEVRPAPQGRREPRPARTPAARAGGQDGAVPRRRRLRARRGRQGRDGGVQRRLGARREPPLEGRARPTTTPGSAAS